VLAQGLSCAALIGFVVVAGGARLPHPLDIALFASAVLQLILAAPLVYAMASRRH
jgi:hypothetical protein